MNWLTKGYVGLCLVVLTNCVWTTNANAACVSGTIQFYAHYSGYCDTAAADCTNHLLWKDKAKGVQPVKEVVLTVFSPQGQALATGTTNTNGFYNVCYAGQLPTVVVGFQPRHSSGAIEVTTAAGNGFLDGFSRPGFNDPNAAFHVHTIGSAAAISGVYHHYHSARLYRSNVVQFMDQLNPKFTNVKIRYAADSTETHGFDKVIRVQQNPVFDTVALLVPHEMGHITHHLTSRDGYLGPDDTNKAFGHSYTSCFPGDNHGFYTQECLSAAYLEGIAHGLGAMALMNASTPNPCISGNVAVGTSCQAAENLERINLEDNICPAGGGQESQVARYAWDRFDDGGPLIRDNFDNIFNAFPEGLGNHEKSELWCCVGWICWVCEDQVANINDWAHHHGSSDELSNQCLN